MRVRVDNCIKCLNKEVEQFRFTWRSVVCRLYARKCEASRLYYLVNAPEY